MVDLLRNERNDNLEGLTLIEKNRYENISEVTHKFYGTSTIEEVMKDIVLSKIKDKER